MRSPLRLDSEREFCASAHCEVTSVDVISCLTTEASRIAPCTSEKCLRQLRQSLDSDYRVEALLCDSEFFIALFRVPLISRRSVHRIRDLLHQPGLKKDEVA